MADCEKDGVKKSSTNSMVYRFFFIILWETLWNFLSLSLFATIIIIILFIIRYWVFFIKTLFFFYIHNDCKNNNSKNKKFQWVQWYLGNKWMRKKFTYFIPQVVLITRTEKKIQTTKQFSQILDSASFDMNGYGWWFD